MDREQRVEARSRPAARRSGGRWPPACSSPPPARRRRWPPSSTPRPVSSSTPTPSRSTTDGGTGVLGGEAHEGVAELGDRRQVDLTDHREHGHPLVLGGDEGEVHPSWEPTQRRCAPMPSPSCTTSPRAAGSCTSSASRPRQARTGSLSSPLPDAVWKALDIPALWSHQAAALDLARPGPLGGAGHRHRVGEVAVLPGRHRRGGARRAGRLGPAAVPDEGAGPGPAAGPDLARACRAWWPRPTTATRTPEARAWARRNANVVLTNPEMLHAALLPFHGRWAEFLQRLRFVVIDELHVLRGIFGSHAGHLLRRLRRLCARYGSVADLRLHLGHHRRAGPPGHRAVRPARRGRDRRRLAPRRAPVRAVEPTAARRGDRDARLGQRRGGPADGGARRGRVADGDVLPQPSRHRAGGRRGPPPGAGGAGRRRCARTAPATSPPSGGRSRPTSSPAGSRASWPPAPSSSASTSAASTPACSTASRARSPRCGSRPGGPAAARGRRWPCWWPAPTSSTSG